MSLATDVNLRSLTSRHTTVSGLEETSPLSLDGAAPVAEVPIPAGQRFIFSDYVICAPPTSVVWRFQLSLDAGVTYRDIAVARFMAGANSRHFVRKTPIRVLGGASVRVRLRVQSIGGAGALITTTIGSANEVA